MHIFAKKIPQKLSAKIPPENITYKCFTGRFPTEKIVQKHHLSGRFGAFPAEYFRRKNAFYLWNKVSLQKKNGWKW